MTIPPLNASAEKVKASNVELPVSLWEALDEVAANEQRQLGRYVSRKEIMTHFLKWAIEDYWKGKPKKR